MIVVNRGDITDEEKETSLQAPPIIMFDAAGNVVSSMGDPGAVPNSIHGCSVDHENNIWVGGNGDGIIQKYSHEGKFLLQIGKRGVFDSTDGTSKGKALNSIQPSSSTLPVSWWTATMVTSTSPMAMGTGVSRCLIAKVDSFASGDGKQQRKNPRLERGCVCSGRALHNDHQRWFSVRV